jgi:glycosyltransferase 2 family protein
MPAWAGQTPGAPLQETETCRMRKSTLKYLQPWLAAAVFAVAAFLVYRALQEYTLSEVLASLGRISWRHLALGAAFTAGSFLCLTGSDALAVRYTNSDLAYPKIALASFTSLSLGHTLGFAALSSGAIRYRFYTGWGLSPGDVARIIVFCGVTVAVGLATAGGLVSVIRPGLVAETFRIAPAAVAATGVILLLVVAIYLGLAAFVHHPIRIRKFELPVPRLRLALGQVAVGTTDLFLVAAVLHQLVSASADIGYFPVAAAYVAANALGILSHVPGGLGVIEAVLLSLVPGANVLGALVAFRAIYFLIPFLIGGAALGISEFLRRRRRGTPGPQASRRPGAGQETGARSGAERAGDPAPSAVEDR